MKGKNCDFLDIQRLFQYNSAELKLKGGKKSKEEKEEIYKLLKKKYSKI